MDVNSVGGGAPYIPPQVPAADAGQGGGVAQAPSRPAHDPYQSSFTPAAPARNNPYTNPYANNAPPAQAAAAETPKAPEPAKEQPKQQPAPQLPADAPQDTRFKPEQFVDHRRQSDGSALTTFKDGPGKVSLYTEPKSGATRTSSVDYGNGKSVSFDYANDRKDAPVTRYNVSQGRTVTEDWFRQPLPENAPYGTPHTWVDRISGKSWTGDISVKDGDVTFHKNGYENTTHANGDASGTNTSSGASARWNSKGELREATVVGKDGPQKVSFNEDRSKMTVERGDQKLELKRDKDGSYWNYDDKTYGRATLKNENQLDISISSNGKPGPNEKSWSRDLKMNLREGSFTDKWSERGQGVSKNGEATRGPNGVEKRSWSENGNGVHTSGKEELNADGSLRTRHTLATEGARKFDPKQGYDQVRKSTETWEENGTSRTTVTTQKASQQKTAGGEPVHESFSTNTRYGDGRTEDTYRTHYRAPETPAGKRGYTSTSETRRVNGKTVSESSETVYPKEKANLDFPGLKITPVHDVQSLDKKLGSASSVDQDEVVRHEKTAGGREVTISYNRWRNRDTGTELVQHGGDKGTMWELKRQSWDGKAKQSQIFFQGNPDASITTTEKQNPNGWHSRVTDENYTGINVKDGELPAKARTYFNSKDKATVKDVWDQLQSGRYQHLSNSDAARRFFSGSTNGEISFASQTREVTGKDGKFTSQQTIVATNASGDRLVFAPGKDGSLSAALFSRDENPLVSFSGKPGERPQSFIVAGNATNPTYYAVKNGGSVAEKSVKLAGELGSEVAKDVGAKLAPAWNGLAAVNMVMNAADGNYLAAGSNATKVAGWGAKSLENAWKGPAWAGEEAVGSGAKWAGRAGKALGVLGVGLDAGVGINKIRNGDTFGGAMDLTSAGGSLMALVGAGTWAGPVGVGIALLAAAGSIGWDQVKKNRIAPVSEFRP